ncbi:MULTISPECIES: NTP transferase domain-containing protein [Microbacterium]|uniref:nucleotidyltransferase family protein n=1 Tax=Microbacterium TaxID=33882 RepID=UPI00278142EE|nr:MULTISPECIES: NTP transferase domain-containing protein [Microbacterium]MDQ1082581.1 CTP:molybdopterin cytidylyltransferase MocA [Microbacterium sp. SORGH_AS_0344]MDQ1168647.1 CTP:molybdopterin cytidylyltransferase MocA [Microbacterium proteolyticum]
MPPEPADHVSGLVLAAGAGRRFGGPKALARTPAGAPWVALAVRALVEGGCRDVTVVLGAGADEAQALVPRTARIVRAEDWAEGMSASLRSGLRALAGGPAVAAVVVPVDTPDLLPSAVARVMRRARPEALAQATYAGRPGHPVLLGRAHWKPLSGLIRGDIGARPYLIAQGADLVECGDLWAGADVDSR